MNLNNISQIRYGGSDITLAKLNGDILYKRGDTPVEPVGNPYYVEYTVGSSNPSATIYATLNGGNTSYKYGLPRIYSDSKTYTFPTSDMVEITLKDGTITNDLSTKIFDIAKVKVYYNEETFAVRFYGSSETRLYVKTVDYINIDNFTDMSYMFYYCLELVSINTTDWDTSNVTNMSYMFYCSNFRSLDVSNFDTSKVTDMSYMFYGCLSLNSLDLSNFDTSKVTDMQYMFYGCQSLNSLDLSNFDTSKVTDMSGMFNSCSGLNSLDLSNFNTSNVWYMSSMFSDCRGLYLLDTTNWDTSNVNYMDGMFENCYSLSLDLSNWNLSNVTNMSSMFRNGCSSYLPSYIYSSLQNADNMFENVNLDSSVIDAMSTWSGLNYSLYSANYMFSGVSGPYELDLSNWGLQNLQSAEGMFNSCSCNINIKYWSSSNLSNYSYMFNGVSGSVYVSSDSWYLTEDEVAYYNGVFNRE